MPRGVLRMAPGGGPMFCPFPQGTLGGILGPLKSKLQMTSSAWLAAHVSRAGRDRPAGTVTPSKFSLVGAAKTQTTQTIVYPIATMVMTTARPAGTRAKNKETRERPV